ncbi:hypothetical protein ACMGE5_06535 [Macrococcus equi]
MPGPNSDTIHNLFLMNLFASFFLHEESKKQVIPNNDCYRYIIINTIYSIIAILILLQINNIWTSVGVVIALMVILNLYSKFLKKHN